MFFGRRFLALLLGNIIQEPQIGTETEIGTKQEEEQELELEPIYNIHALGAAGKAGNQQDTHTHTHTLHTHSLLLGRSTCTAGAGTSGFRSGFDLRSEIKSYFPPHI